MQTTRNGPVSTEEGRTVMQEDIDKLSDWSGTWLLKFNTNKCSVMHLGRTNPKHTYNMRDNDGMYQKLEETEVEKDLGVYVDNKLSFHQHVNTAVNKATRILGVIKRTVTSRSKNIVKRLYTTLVRPTLEYGNAPRTTQYIGDMDKIEKVQRRATKLCTDIKNLSYEERLRELKLQSMYYRREREREVTWSRFLRSWQKETEWIVIRYYRGTKVRELGVIVWNYQRDSAG